MRRRHGLGSDERRGRRAARPEAPLVDAAGAPAPAVGAAAPPAASWRSTAVLGLALAAAIVGVVVYAGRAINPGPAWSSWKPSGGGLGAAKQIAEHISPNYRLPDGNQLVDVIPKGPAVSSGGQTIPIPLLAVRGPKGKILPDRVEAADEREHAHVLALRARPVLLDRDRQAVGRARDARAPRDPRARALHVQVREGREADRRVHAAAGGHAARLRRLPAEGRRRAAS